MLSGSWTSLCGLLAVLCAAQATYTYTYHSAMRCECNGKSRYCLRDVWGLRCVNCQGNTEGRRCERCRDGHYQQGALQSCTACRCNPTGSVGVGCDSRGRCSCKDGVTGDKCDRCPNGPIGPNGCTQSRQPRQDSQSSPCFCYGHSTRCSAARGFTLHTITSTFTDGPEGWRAATAQGVAPQDVQFRWSPKHQDIEVISKNSLPVYLFAPASFLGNQLLSFGQNLSFSLRLDRGVRHPSTSDVVLEGSGLRVSASLGDLRSIVPCGQKISYSFRLDQRPGSRWKPQLSAAHFQTLLQNLTAIKIRMTFGENGRGYLDNVRLVSARRGEGTPAPWVQSCSCPPGYQGQFCERCSSGFKHRSPAEGGFSRCEPCSCRGGDCDPETGDCYSADETPGGRSCSAGSYSDPDEPLSCVKCPCPTGVSCSLAAGSLEVRCDHCPPGTTGSRCHICLDGFYGNPLGGGGLQRPCRPCQCNGHADLSGAGICDRGTGECLKCVNNTRGRQCEACRDGFHRTHSAHACKPCACDAAGSLSGQCSDEGQCQCRRGFEGLKCQRSACPACFTPIKTKMEVYAARLQELEAQVSAADGGSLPVDSLQVEMALNAAQELVNDLQDNTERLAEMEKSLQRRLSTISRSQLAEGRDLQAIGDTADDIDRRQQTYRTKAEGVRTLIDDMRRKLEEAKLSIQSADVPLGDEALGPDFLSTLVQRASELAKNHQTKAGTVEQSANEALSDSEKSLALVRTLLNKENKVKELIGDLKAKYDKTSAQVKALESQAGRLSGEARDESEMADDMLKQIATMEREIPAALKEEAEAAVARLDGLKQAVQGNITGLQALQEEVEGEKATVEQMLADGNTAQQDYDRLLARANAAKAVAEAALQDISSNTDQVDDALNTLRGFDQQIDVSRALADDAIKKLPAINATIRQAVDNNGKTLSIMGAVGGDYNDALGTVNLLENVVSRLEGTSGSLPSHTGLVRDATKLNEELKGLKAAAVAAGGRLAAELDNAKRDKTEAEEASHGAAGAFSSAKQTRDAVGQTLQSVNNLLALFGQPGSVDEQRLTQLEESLANAQSNVNQKLKPRLRDMEDREAAQRSRLSGIQLDIDTVLSDIANLEDILRAVPDGCFNHAAIEHA
ncbi:laminin subunit gamma-2 [Centroberyx gerrardi]